VHTVIICSVRALNVTEMVGSSLAATASKQERVKKEDKSQGRKP
jgi:hypothetical protein